MNERTNRPEGQVTEPVHRPRRVRSGDRRAIVDYALQRKAVLADLYAGRVSVLDVCDAHPYLQRAAKFHGQPSAASCPVCRKERLADVHYVYGESLKTTSGQAKTADELAELAGRHAEFSVYVVEVCRSCGWNHLTSSFVMGARPSNTRGSNTRGRPAGRQAATE